MRRAILDAMRKALSTRGFLLATLTVTLLVAGALSLLASGSPDGLERVAEDEGFLGTATEHASATSPLADYEASFLGGRPGQMLAGIVGVLIVLALFQGLTRVLVHRPPHDVPHEPTG